MELPRGASGVVVLAIVVALAGCHGSSPTGASSVPMGASSDPLSPGSVVTFVSAETGAPAADVDVTVGLGRYRTDASGSIRLADTTILPALVQVSSNAYLLRETVLRGPDSRTLSLWPSQSPTGLDESHTMKVVYTDASGGAPGALPLHRLAAGAVSIVPSAELVRDAAALQAMQDAAAALTDATRGQVSFRVETTASSRVVVRMSVDPSDPAMPGHAALTYRYTESSQITGARTVFLSMAVARMASVVTHELGHSFGLEHSDDPRDLMYPVVSAGQRLSAREVLAISLMMMRRPGNRFPDDDRDGGAQARVVDVVACPL